MANYIINEILTLFFNILNTFLLLLPFQRQSDWAMGLTAAQVVCRSSMIANGEEFVIITGARKTLQWCVGNLLVEILKKPETFHSLVTTLTWKDTQVHALATWAHSTSAHFTLAKEDVEGFLLHVKVRHEPNKNSMWSLLIILCFMH